MSKRSVWNITGDGSGPAYSELLSGLAEISVRFGFVVRSPKIVLSDDGLQVMARLAPFCCESEATQRWPGTQLVGRRIAMRYCYLLDADALAVLSESASSLFDWVNPALPEDLHFLREDGSPVLSTVAQEEEAWLELDDEEYAKISLYLPKGLNLQRNREPRSP